MHCFCKKIPPPPFVSNVVHIKKPFCFVVACKEVITFSVFCVAILSDRKNKYTRKIMVVWWCTTQSVNFFYCSNYIDWLSR